MAARTVLVALATAALVATGCGDDGGERAGEPGQADGTGAPAERSAAPEPAVGGTSEPAVTAEARLEERDGGVSIRVTLDGLEPEARYPVQIHQGPCAEIGRVTLPLGRITGRPDGTGSVRMTVDADRLPTRPFSVRVQDAGGSPVACAEVGGAGP